MIVDLRSDTVTQPTVPMREAMMRAPVGDDVYGEDPTVLELESTVADVLGFEAAVFTPSGTMANQLAISLQTRPGDSVLAEEGTHAYIYESGAAAMLSQVQFDLMPMSQSWDSKVIAQTVRPDMLQTSPTTLAIVENTHTLGLGRALSPQTTATIVSTLKPYGLKLHCDGARLWNASTAMGCTPKELTRGFDTAAVCFSKGLGAPVGSALCGSKDLIAKSRKQRRRWGGGMRQAGILAAGALYGLKHHLKLIPDDHRRLTMLADGLKDLAQKGRPIRCELPPISTNILYFSITTPKVDPKQFVQDCAAKGVKMTWMGAGRDGLARFRAVTHLDVTDAGIAHALTVLESVLKPI